ncbi:MAG: glutamate-5-semialdehyde dehydrogenase [Acidimicrobiales bacterium mtb01]|nr:aldehyde dehydrogenase family protein [Actinomycetota bacterium]TEX45276.1 MAG: glutamate-5-semialdehyde dehydrogenase [Acidimicrobiales bacterium mtb01]
MSNDRLTRLEAGQLVPFGGDRVAVVPPELAASFVSGDRLVVVQETGDLIRIPAAVSALVDSAVTRARGAFVDLSAVSDRSLDRFYDEMASRLADDRTMSTVLRANEDDVADARSRGRSITRLELGDKMRRDMIEGVRLWRHIDVSRDHRVSVVEHSTWTVEERRAPLGVVAFVFEGRPNVFADATGVLRSGNSVVFRIGSDALRTARALMAEVVQPSLIAAGLPENAVALVDSAERSAGHALFSDRRIALAVARGSGEAVSQLGAVARQAGVPVSLHGTGGAWMVIAPDADVSALEAVVDASLDRKVCNTLNVVCVVRERAEQLSAVLRGIRLAGERRSVAPVLRVRSGTSIDRNTLLGVEIVEHDDDSFLAHEYEWDDRPELALRLVDSVAEAVGLCNAHSPWFVASLISNDEDLFDEFYRTIEAPFVGDGFTRWVDGQYALGRPELGLSNWQNGRLFGRGGILSGDGVFAVRYVARHTDPTQRR